MSNPTGSDYVLQNAILREAAKSAAEGTNMSVEKPATDYAAGKSASDADALRFSSDLNLKKEQLAQTGKQAAETVDYKTRAMAQDEKQFLTQLLFAHEQLGTWSKQNDLATLLSAAAIPGQVLSMKKQSDSLDKQNELTQNLIDTNKANVNAVNLANIARAKEFEDFEARTAPK